jgi:hypothetical protein
MLQAVLRRWRTERLIDATLRQFAEGHGVRQATWQAPWDPAVPLAWLDSQLADLKTPYGVRAALVYVRSVAPDEERCFALSVRESATVVRQQVADVLARLAAMQRPVELVVCGVSTALSRAL